VLSRTQAASAVAATVIAAGSAIAAVDASAATPARFGDVVTAMPALDTGIVQAVNAARAGHHLAPLTSSNRLGAAAGYHTHEMLRNGYFSHDSAGGGSAERRIARFYPSAGYRNWMTGETLLWWSPTADAASTIRSWLESPEHRSILLAPGYREIGVSALHATAAGGAFGGIELTLITADFGARTR
jgi:uncharacterized protein YkwD